MGLMYAVLCPVSGWVFGETEEDALDCLEGDPVGDPIRLPTRKEVCWRCRGEGAHDHPAFSNGFTSSEWAEACADDENWAEDYKAGVYDVPCEECDGLRVVDTIDEGLMAPDVLAALHRWWRELADTRAIEAAERRMGA